MAKSVWTGDKIRRIRKHLGISQEKLAKLLGCRQQTVSDWELGLYQPGNAYQQVLSIHLG